MTGIILIIAGSILLLTGIVFISLPSKTNKKTSGNKELENLVELVIADGVFTKNEKDQIKKFAIDKSLDYEPIILDIEDKLNNRGIDAETEIINQEKKNGDDFEKYVAHKFDPKYFKIKEWAGDKFSKGVYAETTLNPDLILEFTLRDEKKSLAVECKWRKKLFKNGVEFAKTDQLERYKKFESEKGIPVFIAIGISGKGAKPENLYIIPLKNITSSFLSIKDLEKFEKQLDKNFFFDTKTGILN